MRKMKRWSYALMAVVLGTALAACGSEETGNETPSSSEGNDNNVEQTEETTTVTEWPHDEVTFIVPFDAGGSVDGMARGIARYFEEELGARITIDNRPGASAQIGATQFMNAPDDGSVFFVGTQLYLSANIVLQDAGFGIEDFSMVNFEQFDPITITVHKNSPYETFDDLIEDIKANPGGISYSTIFGGPLHLTGVLLEDVLDLELNPVFYDGGGEMRNALLGEHVDFMIGNANGDTAIADQVRVLAVASEEQMELWPDAAPINEALSGYDTEVPYVGSARFIAAHTTFKENNPELFEFFTNAYENVFNSDEYQDYLAETGADVVSEFRGPEASDALNLDLHDLMLQYQDDLKD